MFLDGDDEGMERKYLLLIALLVVAIGAAWYMTGDGGHEEAALVEEPGGIGESGADAGRIVVYVSGAVKNPGVYEFPAGARAYEAVKAAGDVLPYADVDHVNLSAEIADGEQLHIPLDPERTVPGAEQLVNINTAGKMELITLPGIGEATAQKILDYRNSRGPFQEKEDIKEVPSIGDGKYAKLADRITV